MPTQRVWARAFCAALLVAMGCSRLVRQHVDAASAAAADPAAPAARAGHAATTKAAEGGHWSFLSFGVTGKPADAVDSEESPFDKLVGKALAAAKSMVFGAAAGGLYRSEDGRLIVSIPPGALLGNATLRFARIDPSALRETQAGTPALFVAVDWGDATFNRDAELEARVQVDERFLAALAQAAPGRTPDQLGLISDGQGKWLLPVRIKADPAGRQEAVSGTLIGSGALVEAARLPVPPTKSLPDDLVQHFDPDPKPTPVAGLPTVKPHAALDPLIERYPAIPAAWYGDDDHHPVNELGTNGCGGIKIRNSTIETLIGQPTAINRAMVSCVLNPCVPTIGKGVVEAVRYNATLAAGRLPPKQLADRVHAKVDCSCMAGSPSLKKEIR